MQKHAKQRRKKDAQIKAPIENLQTAKYNQLQQTAIDTKKTQHQHRNAKITNAVAGTQRCRTKDINWLLPEGSENATFFHIDSCMIFGWIPVAIPASCCYSRAYPFKKYRALPVRFFFMLGSAA